MRDKFSDKLEGGRVLVGDYGSRLGDRFGAFKIVGPTGATLGIIASDATELEAEGWEHVSVSLSNRCPNWYEMDFVKNLFWEETETVVQFHPPRKDWVNCHPNCLHMWRYTKLDIPRPPSILVGV